MLAILTGQGLNFGPFISQMSTLLLIHFLLLQVRKNVHIARFQHLSFFFFFAGVFMPWLEPIISELQDDIERLE